MLPLQRLHDPQSGGQARGIAAMARTSQGRHFRLENKSVRLGSRMTSGGNRNRTETDFGPCLGGSRELGVSRQLDLYPPSGWRIIQDFAATASSSPT